jgi:tripeptidyl-peptidase-1
MLRSIAVFFTIASHGVSSEPRVVLEQGVTVVDVADPSGWVRHARASASETINLIFMLRHDPASLKSFEETLFAVSTPGNPQYGKHLSREEVARQLPPTDGAKEGVLALLENHKVRDFHVSRTGDMIEANMTVAIAEAMFSTELHHFVNDGMALNVVRASKSYSVSTSLADKLYLVGNLAQLPALIKTQVKKLPDTLDTSETGAWPQDCGACSQAKWTTPAVLTQAYELGDIPSKQNATIAMAEFQGVFWDQQDLTAFQQNCNLDYKVTVARQVGPNTQQTCKMPILGQQTCTESLLDVEYIKAVVGDMPLTSVSNLQYSLLNWAKQLDNLDDLPPIHSVSYGNDEVQQTSTAFMDSCNAQFMKLGAQGVSILFASGDQGTYGRTGPGLFGKGKFNPDFPASSPYITAVGGTDFAIKSHIGAEKTWSDGGGGFSDHFKIPSYQADAVASYLKAARSAGNLPSSSLFTSTGRAYPDVAALAGVQNPYCVAVDSGLGIGSALVGVGGTSAACPVVAGVFARLNAQRADKNLPPMGFLNPFIYQNGDAFNDVKLGMNQGMGKIGFTALKGWDPATGFGTPNFPKLSTAALKAAGVDTVVV